MIKLHSSSANHYPVPAPLLHEIACSVDGSPGLLPFVHGMGCLVDKLGFVDGFVHGFGVLVDGEDEEGDDSSHNCQL